MLPAQEQPKPTASDSPTAPKPSFEIADVHAVHPRGRNQFGRFNGAHGGRYEVTTASLLDFIRTAYGFQQDKILGGPSWLEMARYDLTAKVQPDAKPDDIKLMLQSLLEERFALKTHKETKPLPTFALTVGKSPKLKEGDSSGESGCKPQPGANVSGPGIITFSTSDASGKMMTTRIGPDGLITYECRNVGMASFVNIVRTMLGANLGLNPILKETGLEGVWNFDLTFTFGFISLPGGDQGKRVSINDAVEKQLGLKLEKREVPTPVLIVDSANLEPTPNPPGVAEALPPIKLPTEFDVASVKMAEPFTPGGPPRPIRMNMATGGRFTYEGVPLRLLVQRAFNANNSDQLQGLPEMNVQDRYDVIARANVPPGVNLNDPELSAVLLRSLLADRFNMKYHKEQRPVSVYQLAAGKPKLKKADPANRAHCTQDNGPAGSPAGTRLLTCQNVTLQQFADQLQSITPDLNWPVDDVTGIQGNFDISLSFNFTATMNLSFPNRAAATAAGGGTAAAPDASDPTGGYTLYEAIEKELGLKLEKVKRNEDVYVIDHLDAKPTEN